MAFVVVYDACALYGNSLARGRAIQEDRRQRLRFLMNSAVADCLVEGYEPLIDGLKLPDSNDRHVLAAAIKCGAQDPPPEPFQPQTRTARRGRAAAVLGPSAAQPASRTSRCFGEWQCPLDP